MAELPAEEADEAPRHSRGRVRIARVIARLTVGGPTIQVATLTARLGPRFETRLYAGDVSPGEREMTDVLERERVTHVRVHGLGRAIRPSSDLAALSTLIRHLRSFRPHIVHTHTAKAGTLGRLAALICRVPVVVHTFHGHVFHGYFTPAQTRVFLGLERALARITTRVITISPRQFEDITGTYRVAPSDRTCVVRLGFDLDRFRRPRRSGELRKELGLGDEPLVGVVGRLTPIKDHPILFEAFAALHDTGAHLCIIGGGETERELRALSVRLGIERRTHFLGFRTDLDSILADTDIIAVTSRNEGTPVALIEAMAAGCRLVSFDVGGVGDVLADGRWGRLVQDRTATALELALRQELASALRGDPLHHVEQARSHAFEQYGIGRLLRDHETLYESLLRESGARAVRRSTSSRAIRHDDDVPAA